jgi:hypothetical protein
MRIPNQGPIIAKKIIDNLIAKELVKPKIPMINCWRQQRAL